ncbi:MAG: hypothetical protein JXR95_12760 [Deltaproteobacteria bacterium]|nr:hypothetical protein [Deltaproteobacteria bacterium]
MQINILLFSVFFVFSGCSKDSIQKEKKTRIAGSNEKKLLKSKKPFSVVVKIKWKIKTGEKTSVLEELSTLTGDAQGHLHGITELSSEDGHEFIYMKDKICVRLRYEKFICRKPVEDEEVEKSSGILSAFKQLLGEISDGVVLHTENTENGKTRTNISQGSKNEPVKTSDGKFGGKILKTEGFFINDKSGNVLSGTLSFMVKYFDANNKPVYVSVEIQHKLSGSDTKIKMPPDNMISKNWKKPRPLVDRKRLLGETIPTGLKYLFR